VPVVDRLRTGAPSPEIRAFPTHRGRRTHAAIDAAARTVIARKDILATTIADIAAEAGRSAGVLLQLLRDQTSDGPALGPALPRRGQPAGALGNPPWSVPRERAYEAAHWHTCRNRLAEVISVSQ
jgi:hypothetical protein